MSETGFRCPNCGSYENHWLPFSMDIECDACGTVFDDEEASEADNESDDE